MNTSAGMKLQHRIDTRTDYDATVPIHNLGAFEHDSPRSPPHLDHDAIVQRLVAIRESCPTYRNGLEEISRLLEDVESMSPAQLGGRVLSALAWTGDNPGYGFLSDQLQIVVLNLKNLG